MTFFISSALYFPLYTHYFSFQTHLLNSAVFVTAVTSSLERLKASLRTVFPSELVLDTIPDNHVDQHLTDMLFDHNYHQKATHYAINNSVSVPSSSSGADYEAGLKDAVKVLIRYMYAGIHFG